MESNVRFTIKFHGVVGLRFPERNRQGIISDEDGGIIFTAFHFLPAQYSGEERRAFFKF